MLIQELKKNSFTSNYVKTYQVVCNPK